jgi:hypothetical protein
MRQDSYIATSATATPERSNLGNGGNITLNTAFLVSAPLENNDIFATAISGRGETSRLMLKASTGSRPAVARN